MEKKIILRKTRRIWILMMIAQTILLSAIATICHYKNIVNINTILIAWIVVMIFDIKIAFKLELIKFINPLNKKFQI